MSARQRLIAWPRVHRAEHQAVRRTWPAMPSSAERRFSGERAATGASH
ncbi:hypothetical protein [Nonomuraea sp. JJY05]